MYPKSHMCGDIRGIIMKEDHRSYRLNFCSFEEKARKVHIYDFHIDSETSIEGDASGDHTSSNLLIKA